MKYILLFTALCFFVSCKQNNTANSRFTDEQIESLQLDSTTLLNVETDSVITIDLNPFLKKRHFDFGTIIKEIKLVPLETTDESLLSNIKKVLVTDSNIYVLDEFKGGGIVVFDSSGKFVKRIPNGQGPGELLRLYDIAYDTENNELVAYQHSFLLFFTPSGEFIRHERLPFGFYNFTVIPDGYVFKALDRQGNGHLGQLEDYTLFVTDKNFKLKSVAMPVLPSDVNYGGYNYLYKNNHTLNVTQKFTDTVYQYISEANRLKAKYVLDFNKKALPSQYLKGSWDNFENAVRQNDYYFYIGKYLETETHNVFFLENWYIELSVIIFRDKRSGNLEGGTEMRYIISAIPTPNFPIASFGKYFISYYFPDGNKDLLTYSSIITEEDKQKIKNLTEDDNPVLVFYTLKKF